MAILPDSKWVDIIQQPLRVSFGLALGAGLLLLLDHLGVLPLSDLSTAAKPLITIVFVVAGSLTFSGVIAWGIEAFKAHRKAVADREKEAARVKANLEAEHARRQTILGRIDGLSWQEVRHITDALRENSQTIYTYCYSPATSSLMQKGLLKSPGGPHHQDHYPFRFPDFVWEVLVERRDELIQRDDERRKLEKSRRTRGSRYR